MNSAQRNAWLVEIIGSGSDISVKNGSPETNLDHNCKVHTLRIVILFSMILITLIST